MSKLVGRTFSFLVFLVYLFRCACKPEARSADVKTSPLIGSISAFPWLLFAVACTAWSPCWHPFAKCFNCCLDRGWPWQAQGDSWQCWGQDRGWGRRYGWRYELIYIRYIVAKHCWFLLWHIVFLCLQIPWMSQMRRLTCFPMVWGAPKVAVTQPQPVRAVSPPNKAKPWALIATDCDQIKAEDIKPQGPAWQFVIN